MTGPEGTPNPVKVTHSPAMGMQAHVSPPEKFTFSMPNTWPQWRKRFERYMSISGQNDKLEEEKINLLVYIMGEESEDILLQAAVTPKSYAETLQCFENHFVPRRNIIFERYKFNSKVQKPGESVESFITSLHSLAESCDYGALKEELIRDKHSGWNAGLSDK